LAIRTTKTNATTTRTSSEIDLFDGVSASRQAKRNAAEIAAEIIIENIQTDLNATKSPVSGEQFKRLDDAQKRIKRKRGEPTIPNLELSGTMRDQLDVKVTGSGKIEVGVFGDAAPRADGHNNLSGKSALPLRQFLPKEGEDFRSGIQRELNQVIAEAVAESVTTTQRLPARRLQNASSKSAFFDILREFFVDFTNAQIETAVFRNPELVLFFRDRNLLRFFNGSNN